MQNNGCGKPSYEDKIKEHLGIKGTKTIVNKNNPNYRHIVSKDRPVDEKQWTVVEEKD